jgi:YesN/AraC family two-component response regulator
MGLNQPLIAALSGHSEDSYIKRAVSCGVNIFLSKPIEVNKLKQITNALEFKINSKIG